MNQAPAHSGSPSFVLHAPLTNRPRPITRSAHRWGKPYLFVLGRCLVREGEREGKGTFAARCSLLLLPFARHDCLTTKVIRNTLGIFVEPLSFCDSIVFFAPVSSPSAYLPSIDFIIQFRVAQFIQSKPRPSSSPLLIKISSVPRPSGDCPSHAFYFLSLSPLLI